MTSDLLPSATPTAAQAHYPPTVLGVALAALEHAAEKFNTATEHVTLATKTVVMLTGSPAAWPRNMWTYHPAPDIA